MRKLSKQNKITLQRETVRSLAITDIKGGFVDERTQARFSECWSCGVWCPITQGPIEDCIV
jgi:hypothetical protein